jgi:hypothetical protein
LNISPDLIDYIIMGTVIQEVKTANIAREVGALSHVHPFTGLPQAPMSLGQSGSRLHR